MQRLILLRHGEAQARTSRGIDLDRPLTPSGEAAAVRTAMALAAAGATPDVVLISNARRTVDTWDAARDSFPATRIEIKPELYNAGAGAILKAAMLRLENTVMVVGHNPGLQTLALDLLKRQGATSAAIARVESRFPPATAAVFTFDENERPELEALLMGGGA